MVTPAVVVTADDVVAAANAEGVIEGEIVPPELGGDGETTFTADDVVAAATDAGVIEGDVVTATMIISDDVVAAASCWCRSMWSLLLVVHS